MLVSEVLNRTYDEYLSPAGVDRPAFDTLASGIDAAVLSLTLGGRVVNVPRDTILEIGSELILNKSTAGAVCTLAQRGYLDTTAATHSSGDIVNINPQYPRQLLFNALNAIIGELLSWGLYVRAIDTTQTYSTSAVKTLPAGGLEVLSILIRNTGTNETYTTLDMPGRDWILHRAFSPSKYQIRTGTGNGQPITVTYTKDFTPATSEANDLLTVCGVPVTLQPHLPMAIAGRLLQGKELTRVHIQEIRRLLAAQNVAVGSSLNVANTLFATFQRIYVGAERRRLFILDPPRFEWVRS